MKCLNSPCRYSDLVYKDTLNNHFGIGNVNLTFEDITKSIILINDIPEITKYSISLLHTPKTLNLNNLRFLGYETMSY